VLSAAAAPPASAAEEAESLRVGSHVPPLQFTDLEGKEHTNGWGESQSMVTLFFFFDIRTAPGLLGLTYLDRTYRKAFDFGLRVLAVEGSGLGREAVLKGLEKYHSIYSPLPFPVAADPEGTLRRSFGVGELPVSFLVERHGVITDHRKGFDERTEAALSERLRHFLSLPPGTLAESPVPVRETAGPEEEPVDRPLLFAGDKTPPLDVTDMNGKEHRFLWSSEDGEITIIFFWSDPCRSCIEEMLFLDQLSLRTTDIGLHIRILSVAAGDLDVKGTEALLERYAARYPPPSFPIVLDRDFPLSRVFGRGRMPTTYFVDEKGNIIAHADDFEEGRIEEWKRLIEMKLPRARGALQYLSE
jgi:peroxiredoxin